MIAGVTPSAQVLSSWSELAGSPALVPADSGLINQTLLVGQPPRYVLQWVNPIFRPEVHQDIDVVTRHLRARGMVTPLLMPTTVGGLYAQDEHGAVWRLMGFVPGQTLHRVDKPATARAAGRLVARFHAALDDLQYTYTHVRPGFHDTLQQMAWLEAGLPVAQGSARALAEQILSAWQRWDGALDAPRRHCHGDLKISNLRFDAQGEGVCLLDLDTLSSLPLSVEMGDALRSWCNPVGEDSTETVFDVALFDAAVAGYRQLRTVSEAEEQQWLAGIERIALELASRFCRDVWEDCYFGWDPRRFPSRAAHNLFRATGQYHLAAAVRQHRAR